MFRTLIVHLQERSYAVCCSLDVSIRPVFMRVKEELQFLELLDYTHIPNSQISRFIVNCVHLGHYAVSSGNLLPTFRDNLSVPSAGFKNPKMIWIFEP